MSAANLLPWRQQQKRHCLRFWGLLFTGSLLVTLGLWTARRADAPLQAQVFAQRQASDVALRQALAQRQTQWTARIVQRQQQQRWAQKSADGGMADDPHRPGPRPAGAGMAGAAPFPALYPLPEWLRRHVTGACGAGESATPAAGVYPRRARRDAPGRAGALAI